MRLVPDGIGGYKYIDIHVGDIIPDGLGGYKFYNPEEDNKNTKYIYNARSCGDICRWLI